MKIGLMACLKASRASLNLIGSSLYSFDLNFVSLVFLDLLDVALSKRVFLHNLCDSIKHL